MNDINKILPVCGHNFASRANVALTWCRRHSLRTTIEQEKNEEHDNEDDRFVEGRSFVKCTVSSRQRRSGKFLRRKILWDLFFGGTTLIIKLRQQLLSPPSYRNTIFNQSARLFS